MAALACALASPAAPAGPGGCRRAAYDVTLMYDPTSLPLGSGSDPRFLAGSVQEQDQFAISDNCATAGDETYFLLGRHTAADQAVAAVKYLKGLQSGARRNSRQASVITCYSSAEHSCAPDVSAELADLPFDHLTSVAVEAGLAIVTGMRSPIKYYSNGGLKWEGDMAWPVKGKATIAIHNIDLPPE